MRLSAEQLIAEGEDGGLIHFADTVFLLDEQPERVGVAVSGGGDSMALLHVAWRWSVLSGVPIEAVTVNHGLRDEAEQEAAMVAAFCHSIGVAHTVLDWDGSAAHGNIAAAGRDARYRLIGAWAKDHGIAGVLLGHTADDIAETFLMRLARKSGVDGLAIMDRSFDRAGVMWGRPFWQQHRDELRTYLQRHGIAWVDDPTNADETHERPKARRALAALAPLGITQDVLKSVALNMASARSALEHYTVDEARRVLQVQHGDVVIEQRANPPVPSEIERRMLVAALQFVGGGAYAPRYDAILKLEIGLMQSGKHTLAGCIVTSDRKELRVTRELNAIEGPMDWPNRTRGLLWDRRWLVSEDADSNLRGNLQVRALGEALKDVPNWRETGVPRDTLRATPAVFDGETLIAAPLAGLQNGFEARIVADFTSFLLSR